MAMRPSGLARHPCKRGKDRQRPCAATPGCPMANPLNEKSTPMTGRSKFEVQLFFCDLARPNEIKKRLSLSPKIFLEVHHSLHAVRGE
eukprot:2944227-Alexandrium_andersonii.AAC.1